MKGLTLLEVLVAASILLLIVGAAATSVAMDGETQRVIVSHLGAEMKAAHALRRIEADLRLASIWGEDLNQNGELDPGEDTNENGVLDSAFRIGTDLRDAAVLGPSIRFNQRVDERTEEGELIASGVFSGPLGYRLNGKRLVRDAPAGSAVIATGIENLSFRREDRILIVSFDVRLPPRVYRTDRRTYEARILMRN